MHGLVVAKKCVLELHKFFVEHSAQIVWKTMYISVQACFSVESSSMTRNEVMRNRTWRLLHEVLLFHIPARRAARRQPTRPPATPTESR